jgi:hypothetical protein
MSKKLLMKKKIKNNLNLNLLKQIKILKNETKNTKRKVNLI